MSIAAHYTVLINFSGIAVYQTNMYAHDAEIVVRQARIAACQANIVAQQADIGAY